MAADITSSIAVGINLCDSIIEYIRNFNTRDDQLASLLRQSQHLKDLIHHLDRIARDASTTLPEASYKISAILTACDAELKSLGDFISRELPASSIQLNMKEKMKDAGNKAVFPFKQSDIAKFDTRLQKATKNLSLSMEAMQLDSQAVIHRELTKATSQQLDMSSQIAKIDSGQSIIQTELNKITSGQLTVQNELNTIITEQSATQDTVNILHGGFEGMQMEMRAMRQLLESQSISQKGQGIMPMLLSTPSTLKQACDAITPIGMEKLSSSLVSSSTSSHHYYYGIPRRSCGCRPRSIKGSRMSRSWISFSLLEQASEDRSHAPGCVNYQLKPSEKTYTLSLTYTGLRRHLSTAVAIGFRISRGAGGCSISPTLQAYRTIYSSRSPAFAVSKMLLNCLHTKCNSSMQIQVVDKCTQLLRELYTTKKALPTDVNEHGATVLTDFSASMSSYNYCDNYLYMQVMNKFLQLEIPTQGVGSSISAGSAIKAGLLLLQRLQTAKIFDVAGFAELVAYSEGDVVAPPIFEKAKLMPLATFRGSVETREGLLRILSLENNPLAAPLLFRDEPKLRAVLSKHATQPLSLEENGLQLVDFALTWPRGLQILLETCSATNIDSYLRDPLTIKKAVEASYYMCDDVHICNENCVCCGSLGYLLEARAHIDVTCIGWSIASQKAVMTLLIHVRHWRQKLAELARAELTPEEQVNLGVGSDVKNVLDYHCREVIQLLRGRGIDPGQRLGISTHDSRLNDSDLHHGSIYHHIHSKAVAAVAFGLGFVDINCADHLGRTPFSNVGLFALDNPDYVQWLAGQGASIWRSTHGYTPRAHELQPVVTHALTLALALWNSEPVLQSCKKKGSLWPLFEQLGQNAPDDDCDCACVDSRDGCTSFLGFLKCYIAVQSSHKWITSPEDIARLLDHFNSRTHDILYALFERYLIRLMAHMLLGLRHTCCLELSIHLRGFPVKHTSLSRRPKEECAEIRQEDAPAIEQLEELVTDLQSRYEKSPLSIFTFLLTEGIPFMREAYKDLHAANLTQTEMADMTAIGVVLTYGPTRPIIENKPSVKRYDKHTIEFWMQKLDKIRTGDFIDDFWMPYGLVIVDKPL